MEVRGVDFLLYKVSDFRRALEFYRDTLGLPVESTFGDKWAELSAGQVTIALGQPEPDGSAGSAPGVEMALAVDDVKAAVEELRGKGVSIIKEASETPVCHLAVVADPDGHRILLHQRIDGTAG